ncbi:sulfurtransferase [Microbacterium aoyamense]|uniref:Sulfurtransferase n=1 Tax=Microbacterium aoyamense TaxID=344166 RepID=A0ABP5AMF6_9MICO|nr:sulfurtransferase [Microbacterium aoyamense]
MSRLISAAQLADLMAARNPVRLLDVRWSLAETNGRSAYLSGHIPGAVWVDLENELSRPGEPDEGRHPLPSQEDLQASARRWGLRGDEAVVAYDAGTGLGAARAWWLLSRAGVDVRVLDGGLAAWRRAGGRLESGEVVIAPGTVELESEDAGVLTMDQAAALPSIGVLIDARASERYRGEVEPIDPIAGHIPGAISVPSTTLLDEEGRVKDHAALRTLFAEVGIIGDQPVGVYCGSGLTAAQVVLVLSELRIDASLFPGSWSAWSNSPGRAVERSPSQEAG